MYRSESISSSMSSVNGKTRGSLDREARVDGVSLTEKIRTKNGKITKAKAQMRKTASILSPEVLYFFRDEMEKEAVLTPASALKAMQSPNRTMQALGRAGGRLQEMAAGAAPTIQSMNEGAQVMGPAYALTTAKADAAKALLQKMGLRKRVANAATFEGGASPLPTMNPLDPQGPLASRAVDYAMSAF